MKNAWLGFCIALLAVVLVPTAVPGESAPFASPDAVFAFANDSGTDLLTGSSEESSGKVAVKAISQAICPGNRILDVTFSRHQAHSPKDNGRQTSGNFRNLEGDLFHIVRGQAKADETCLLATRDYMQGKRLVSLKTTGMTPEGLAVKPAKCDAETKKNIPSQQNRAPVSCWQLAKIGDNGRLLAVNYEPRQKNLLAALVLQMGDRSMVHEMPATADSTSAWREGDEGKFDPSDFTPLFVLQNEKDGSWEVGIVWSGEEGGSLSVYRSKGSLLEEVVKGYRYWMPE